MYDRIKDTVLLQGASAVILTVPNRVQHLSSLFPWLQRRLYFIPVGTGITVASVTPSEQQTERARLGIQPDEWIVGSFGTLHTDRRYDTLFKTVRHLLDQGFCIRILLIGAYEEDHDYYAYLKKCIADLGLEPYIIWTGFGTSVTISRWLALVDIYVMTDLRGASGRKSSLTTALAHSLPIISTRGGDTTPEFEHGKNILLFDVDDEKTLGQHIIRLLHNQEERTRLRTGAQTLYTSKYAWESIARSTLKVYRNHYGPGAER
jgi:glycosyltransferase involved in cell wall biosynthesis